MNLLTTAVEERNAETLETLLRNGLDPNFQNVDGFTILMVACYENNINDIKLLLRYGADINIQNKDGLTALSIACANDSADAIKLLMGKDNDTIVRKKEWNTNPISVRHNINAVTLLLERSEDHDLRNMSLAWAFYNNYVDLIKLLLEKDIELNFRDKKKNTNLVCAYDYITAIKLWLKKWDADLMKMVLVWAFYNNYVDVIKVLLENGADPNTKDIRGNYVLIIACKKNVDVVELLLEKGADPNKNTKGKYALSYACINNNIVAVKTLLENGADPESKDIYGKSIIDYVSKKKKPKIYALLKKYKKLTLIECVLENNLEGVKTVLRDSKIDVDYKDSYGKTALIYALENYFTEIAEYLMSKGAVMFDPEKRKQINMLMSFVKIGDNSGIKTMIESYGVDINSKDKDGNFALFIALENKNFDTVEFLHKNGAITDIEKDGKHFIEYVFETKNQDIVEYFTHRSGVNISIVHPLECMISSIKNENEYLIRYIIEKNILPKDEKFENKSLMFYAMTTKNFDIIKVIGSNFEFNPLEIYNSKTLIDYSIETGNYDIVHFVIEKEKSTTADLSDLPDLFYAIRTKNKNLVNFLTERNIDIDSTVGGMNPLFYAFYSESDAMFETVLKSKKINIDEKYQSKSVLFHSLIRKRFSIFEYLVKNTSVGIDAFQYLIENVMIDQLKIIFDNRSDIYITESYDSHRPIVIGIMKSKNIEFIKYIFDKFSIDYTTKIWKSKSIKDIVLFDIKDAGLIDFMYEKIYQRINA